MGQAEVESSATGPLWGDCWLLPSIFLDLTLVGPALASHFPPNLWGLRLFASSFPPEGLGSVRLPISQALPLCLSLSFSLQGQVQPCGEGSLVVKAQ